jgi:hypothetical protein
MSSSSFKIAGTGEATRIRPFLSGTLCWIPATTGTVEAMVERHWQWKRWREHEILQL